MNNIRFPNITLLILLSWYIIDELGINGYSVIIWHWNVKNVDNKFELACVCSCSCSYFLNDFDLCILCVCVFVAWQLHPFVSMKLDCCARCLKARNHKSFRIDYACTLRSPSASEVRQKNTTKMKEIQWVWLMINTCNFLIHIELHQFFGHLCVLWCIAMVSLACSVPEVMYLHMWYRWNTVHFFSQSIHIKPLDISAPWSIFTHNKVDRWHTTAAHTIHSTVTHKFRELCTKIFSCDIFCVTNTRKK